MRGAGTAGTLGQEGGAGRGGPCGAGQGAAVGGPASLQSLAVRGAVQRPVCLRPHWRQAGVGPPLHPRGVGQARKGFKHGSDRVRSVFFLNCELRCVRVHAAPPGGEVWRRWLCCPVGWASLAAGDSPTGLGEEPAGLSAVDPVLRAWVLSLPACFQFCLHRLCLQPLATWGCSSPVLIVPAVGPNPGRLSQGAEQALASFLLTLEPLLTRCLIAPFKSGTTS